IHRHLDRLVFADANGMVLYTYDRDEDTPGTSNCTLEMHCSRRWPPLYASPDSKPVGEWTIIRRQDGTLQWAFRGKPVYRYADDLTPGTDSGDNSGRVWHTAHIPLPTPKVTMPAGFKVVPSDEGWAFANHEDRKLYVLKSRKACDAACMRYWDIVRAPMLAQPVGDWHPVKEGDALQWSFRGMPLYMRKPREAAPAEATAAFDLLLLPDASAQHTARR
ncbi:MAG TPA: hypothetical protein VIL28_08330, partial [Steroidobacteraceae bacterium]